jgi:gamma-glutamyltranspeptidase/glutathione hydrolase
MVTAGLAVLPTGCDSLQITRRYENGALATGAPLATTLGREIFAQGGNAFDVAVTVGFVLAVVHPEAGNIGGGGFAVIREGETGVIRTLDFREKASMAATESMYLNDSGEVIKGLSTGGAKAAGVPGTVAGLYELWKSHGSLPWADLVRVAADLADSGFAVDQYLVESLAEYQEQLTGFEETSEIFFPDGRTLQPGDRLVQKDLAGTLYHIATHDRSGFYDGVVAEKIVACMQKYGGLISRFDLAAYTPVWRKPIRFSFDSLEICTMSPPSSGGIVMGQILLLLKPYDLSRYTPMSAGYIHLFVEASRLAFADRSVHLGDPEYHNIPSELLSESYLAERRAAIDASHASTSEQVGPGNPSLRESDQTTHFSVCDSDGNMVAISYTLNTNYGCKLMVGGAGFLLNNQMDDFSIKPGYPNTWGLVGAEANKIEPGKRMLSSMAPTILLRDGQPFLILGSPGGSKIITTVAQAIINLTRFGLNPQETVAHPRFHHQWLPDQIYVEEHEFDRRVRQELAGFGHKVKERSHYGDLQLIHIDRSGLMTAASDHRRDGLSAGY